MAHTLAELRALWKARRLPEAWAVYCALSTDMEAETHMLGAQVAWAMDALHEARYACERAFTCAPSSDLLCNLRFRYATVLLRVGQPEMAVAQFRAWLEGQQEYATLASGMLGYVWNNLGLSYWRAGRPEDALAAFHNACAAFRAEGIGSTPLCRALLNLAWVECLFNNAVQAQEALSEARTLAMTESLRWHHRVGEAFCQFTAGELSLAHATCEEIRQYPGDEIPIEVRSHACWVAGSVELVLGQFETAERLAREGIDLGARAKERESRCLYDNADLLQAVLDRHNAPLTQRYAPAP